MTIYRNKYRLRIREFMLEGAMGAAANAYRKGWHIRSAAMDYSLPGPLGQSRLNGSERSIVERRLRTVYGDYTRLRPGSGVVPVGRKNDARAYTELARWDSRTIRKYDPNYREATS